MRSRITKSQPARQDQQIFLSLDGYITENTGARQRKVKLSIFKLISVRCVKLVESSVPFCLNVLFDKCYGLLHTMDSLRGATETKISVITSSLIGTPL